MAPIVTRDRFEERGVALQDNARNFRQARRLFDKSCTLCMLYGRNADCDACPIREAMLAGSQCHKLTDEDYVWLRMEVAG